MTRTGGALAVVAMLLATAAAGDDRAPEFVVETNSFLVGQAADWLDDRHVVWHDPIVRDDDGDRVAQIHRSALDGSEQVCLTCAIPGPNQVPVVQPNGPWVLFHSWNGHAVRVGAPGFGGIGSDVWVMRRDGSLATNLTRTGELHDNFHAYWSPDGRYIVWTALDWDPADGGNGRSDVRVARFDPHGPDGPRLVDEHAVRPRNGHWYETQWWAPDGSGFLYTETADTAVNPELFFCRLPQRSGACHPVRLTTDPAWDEQAIFTPDMDHIVFMSSRNLPGAHNDWSTLATLLGLPAEYDYELILFVFSDGFLQPRLQQATDLYELTLRWNRDRTRFKPGAVRRLTTSGENGWVIPEFAWDPRGRRLLWTQNKFPETRRLDQSCVVRQIRAGLVARLSGVDTIAQLPFDIVPQIRAAGVALLGDPRTYSFAGTGCGGEAPDAQPSYEQETHLGHFER